MAKRKGRSPIRNVQSGVNRANVSLKSLSDVLTQQTDTLKQLTENSAVVQDAQTSRGGANIAAQLLNQQIDLQQSQVAVLKKILDGINKQIKASIPTGAFAKDSTDWLQKISNQTQKQIDTIYKQNKDWKSFGDKFKDLKRNLKESIDPDNIKRAILGPFKMFKGVRDKIEDIDYSKRMRALGDTRSRKELREAAKDSRGKKENLLRIEDLYQRIKSTGASDRDIAQSNPKIVQQRQQALNAYQASRVVPGQGTKASAAALTQLPSDKGQISQSTTDVLAEKATKDEQTKENLRLLGSQTDLLQQIASNTALMAGKKSSSAGGAEDAGQAAQGRGAGGFGQAMSAIGAGIGDLGAGIGKGVGAMIGGIFQGIMEGIANGISAFGTVKVVKGVAVLGLITGVVWAFGKAMETFQNLDWDTIGKGAMISAAIVAGVAMLGSFVGAAVKGGLALAAIGGGLWVLGKGLDAMGDAFNNFINGIERLSNVGFEGLAGVAGGMVLIGGALAAFAAGQVAAGLGTLISNLLTIGQDSPLEQLQKLADIGPRLGEAANGITNIGQAMKAFSGIDKKSMDAINDFPWVRATAFVAAGGAMSVNGAKVYNQSKANADEGAKAEAKGGGGGNTTTANVQQNNNSTSISKPAVRNNESSYTRYLQARY